MPALPFPFICEAPGSCLGAGYAGAACASCANSTVTWGTVSDCPFSVVSWLLNIGRGGDPAKQCGDSWFVLQH